MRFIPIIVYFLFIPFLALAQLGSSTTMKKIDEIRNNTGTDIILNPTDKVDINYFTGEKALQSTADGELEESSVTNTELSYVSGVTSGIQGQIDGKQDSLPLSTDGDLLYYNGGFSSLPIGTSGQVLTTNGSLLPEWQDIIAVSVTTKGDLQTYSTEPTRLPVGTPNQLLSANPATATGLEWIDAPATSPTTTIGDIIYNNTGSASGDTRLPIGNEDEVLKVSGGVPVWGTVAQSSVLWEQEIPTGTIDGVNQNFSLSSTPFDVKSVQLYRNGLILRQGIDYNITGANVAIAVAPSLGDDLYAVYDKRTE